MAERLCLLFWRKEKAGNLKPMLNFLDSWAQRTSKAQCPRDVAALCKSLPMAPGFFRVVLCGPDSQNLPAHGMESLLISLGISVFSIEKSIIFNFILQVCHYISHIKYIFRDVSFLSLGNRPLCLSFLYMMCKFGLVLYRRHRYNGI